MRLTASDVYEAKKPLCRSHRNRRGQPGWTWRSNLFSNQAKTSFLIAFFTLSLTNAPKLKKIDKFFFKNRDFF